MVCASTANFVPTLISSTLKYACEREYKLWKMRIQMECSIQTTFDLQNGFSKLCKLFDTYSVCFALHTLVL